MTTREALASGPYDEGQSLSQSQLHYQRTSGGRAAQPGRGPADENQEGLRP